MKSRTDIINKIIKINNYQTYLEIGLGDGKNFKQIDATNKDGVDPNVVCRYKMNSDKFFNELPKDKKYDIIFVDGLHLEANATRDIENSLKHLNKNGTIIVHDCNPIHKRHQRVKNIERGPWNGTTWVAFAKLRSSRSDLSMCVINSDSGCGIITFGKQSVFRVSKNQKFDWEFLDTNRKELLNLITYEEFFGV